jgi:hypothetical protein
MRIIRIRYTASKDLKSNRFWPAMYGFRSFFLRLDATALIELVGITSKINFFVIRSFNQSVKF